MKYKVTPTNQYREMREQDFIVSKTDLKGHIIYANRIFIEFGKYSEEELIGSQHSIVRHPDMPRAIFKLLWDTVQKGDEIFAYVKNMAKDGSYYWVFANVTPVRDERENIVGYYSVRRKPRKEALEIIIPLYKSMCAEESRNDSRNQIEASSKILQNVLQQKGLSYEEFILGI